MSENLPEKSSSEIAADLVKFKQEMEALRELIQPFLDKKNEIQGEIKDHRQEIERLNALSLSIDMKVKDSKEKMKSLEFDLSRKSRELTAAQQRDAIREEFEASKSEFERITAGAPWREFAFDHQIKGAMHLAAARRGILGDKPGLGKSLTSIIWADMLKSERIIVVLPKDTMSNFKRELEHWAPHRSVFPIGGEKKSTRNIMLNMLKSMPNFVALFNYDAWRRDADLLDDIIALKADTIIVDEAHNMKNFSTLRARGIRKIALTANACFNCGADVKIASVQGSSWKTTYECINADCKTQSENAFDFCSIKNVMPMTGTTIVNKPQDLFPMLNLVDPVTFPSEIAFLKDFCYKDSYSNKWKFTYGGQERLIKKLQTQFLVRTRKDAGIILPPQDVQVHEIEFDHEKYPEQSKVLSNLNTYAQIAIDDESAYGILYIIELILRKRQALVWPDSIQIKNPRTKEVLYKVSAHESIKVDTVIHYDEESQEWSGLIPDLVGWEDDASAEDMLNNGERIVVFSQFISPQEEILRRCREAGIAAVLFNGSTPDHIREDIKIDIDKNYAYLNGRKPKYQVILAHYQVGGVGLNMTDLSQMIILDNPWNPAGEEQAYNRIDRIGQTKETTVHVLEVQNSIDSWMRSVIEDKRDMIQGFEKEQSVAQAFIEAMRNGEIL